MITGFKVQLSSDELREHLAARAQHHAERFDFYAAEVAKFTDEAHPYASGDPLAALRSRMQQHQKQAAEYQYLAVHVVPDETYLLDRHELGNIELVEYR